MADLFDDVLGHTPDGVPIGLVRLRSERLRVGLTDFGARMLSIETADREGAFDHVLLGFDDSAIILKAGSFGAVLGRFANRIAGARFTLDGITYALSQNDGPNTLHGGKAAFAKLFWRLVARSRDAATFALTSPDGDQGFPGTVEARAHYRVEADTLRLTLTATTDMPTPVNLSAHPYFNLAGAAALDVCDHTLEVAAEHFLPTDATQIPTGERRPVAGTPFDFRKPVLIGSRVRSADPQMRIARGFDHCFLVDGAGGAVRLAAKLVHPRAGRMLELETDAPGLQVYTGNSLDGSLVGHGGTYRQTAGLALEAQGYPDAPNQPSFPSTILHPGQEFSRKIFYRFSAT